jgi:hypothetical protein
VNNMDPEKHLGSTSLRQVPENQPTREVKSHTEHGLEPCGLPRYCVHELSAQDDICDLFASEFNAAISGASFECVIGLYWT